jgi:hypothetical protein
MFAIVGLVLSFALAQQADSQGSGSLVIDGTTIELAHAVKTTRKNPFNDFFSDPVVILSDKPVSEDEAASDAALLARAQQGDTVILAVRFDGRPKRGQLFNVGIAHKGLQDTVLLPDVWFKYTFKAGAGTLTLAPQEMSGHTYATDVKFSIPMPVEATDEEKTAATLALPGPSKTDADRQRASQLLVDALQEGDEARALAIVPLGIDPNFKDSKMGIALINWAVLMCQPPVVAALVELKADLTHERLPGMTLLAEARAACPEAVGYLRAGGAQ